MKQILLLALVFCLAACASQPLDTSSFTSADNAILAAERAGADELAPVELRFAREKLAEARQALESKDHEEALWLVDQSEINSELAIEQSRTAKSRRNVNEMRRANDLLREELVATFGEDFE